MIRRLSVLVALTLTASWVVHTTTPVAQSQPPIGYRDVSSEELRELLMTTDPFLLDVHTPNEGYLAGTDARIPYNEVADQTGELQCDPDAAIVVYCMSGRMSEIAATQLASMGYRNVLNLAGGMVAWQAAGYELLPD